MTKDWFLPGRKKLPKSTGSLSAVDRRNYYGGQVYDGQTYTCSICCKRPAFAHSVRIKQDEPGTPVCIDCRLSVTRGALAAHPRRDAVRRLFQCGPIEEVAA